MHTRRGKQANKSCTPQFPSPPPPAPQQAQFPAPSPLSKPTRTACTDAEARGAGERRQTRPSSRRTRGLVTPVTSTPLPPHQPSGALGSTAPPRAPPPAGGFAVPNSVPLGCGRPRTSREGGGRRGRGGRGRGGGWKARESVLRAAPLPRACQQRALGGSGPNRARRLASTASARSRLRGSPGLSEVPTRPGSPQRRPAPAPQLARSTAPGKVASGRARPRPSPAPQPRAATKDREDERRRQSREGEHPERGQPSGGGGTEGGRLGVSGRTGWGGCAKGRGVPRARGCVHARPRASHCITF